MKNYRELRDVLRACADVTRLHILDILADGQERSVSDLTAAVRQSQPLVSWHLRMLRRSGLIVTRRTGRQAMYRFHRAAWDRLKLRLDEVVDPDPILRVAPGAVGFNAVVQPGVHG